MHDSLFPMWVDVIDLRDFYETQLGQIARRLVRLAVRRAWPDVEGQCVLGLGYAAPYLLQFNEEAERVLAFMPGPQGVIPWPANGENRAALIEEHLLPLPDESVDRVLLVHAVENSEALRLMLREVWRVMKGDGRLLIVAPNRRGLWAQSDRTPFGWGRPYSRQQLSHLLREHSFAPLENERVLFVPPLDRRWFLGSAVAWERVGRRWLPRFAGVNVMQASKELYAATPVSEGKRVRRRAILPIPQPAARREDMRP